MRGERETVFMNYSTIRLYDYGHDMEREGGKARIYRKTGFGG